MEGTGLDLREGENPVMKKEEKVIHESLRELTKILL